MIQLYKGINDTQIVMGDNGSTPLWISEDGDYGLTPITIFDAHNWTASDFETLDNSTASERVYVAKSIHENVSGRHQIEENVFLDAIRRRAPELGLRLFVLTDEGMDELLP
jgi:hypothetical protein